MIPDKLYFSIGEVAKLANVKPHVLRFWEQEFPNLLPKKDESGRRIYRKKDVELVLDIRRLLYDEKFTLAGARRVLMGGGGESVPEDARTAMRHDLELALALLKEAGPVSN